MSTLLLATVYNNETLPGRPTEWRELVAGKRHLDTHAGKVKRYKGAACYELGITRNTRRPKLVYVGEAKDIDRRLFDHAGERSNIQDKIRRARNNGFQVWYRYFKVRTAKDAGRFESKQLRRWWPERYCWNTQKIYSNY